MSENSTITEKLTSTVTHQLYPQWLFWGFEAATALLGGGCVVLGIAFYTPGAAQFDYWNYFGIYLIFSTPVAAALTGFGLFRYCLARIHWITTRRAIGASMLFNILAHPLAWYLACVLTFVMHLLNPSYGSINLDVNPLWAILVSIQYSFSSLILVGWLTLLVSALMSVGLISLLRRLNRDIRPVQNEHT